jgi:hypothetical protein
MHSGHFTASFDTVWGDREFACDERGTDEVPRTKISVEQCLCAIEG